MTCPKCHHNKQATVDSRSKQFSESIRRRRRCVKCGHRWTTYEVAIEQDPGNVTKHASVLFATIATLKECVKALEEALK